MKGRITAVFRGGLLLAFLIAAFLTGSLFGQILNTLRGWSDVDHGWSMELEGAISLSRGNTEHLDLSAGSSIQLIAGGHRVRFLLSETYKTVDGNRTAEDFKVHLRHNYRLTPVFHTLVFVQDQYNPYQRLERRSLLGGGLRMDILRDSLCMMALGGSVMLEYVELTDDSLDESGTDTRGSFFVSMIWEPLNGSVVDLSGFYQPLFPGFDDPLMTAALNIEASIGLGLSLFTRADISHDSRPPEGVESTDLTLSSGLRFSL
mgnify:CR=1 FL=1